MDTEEKQIRAVEARENEIRELRNLQYASKVLGVSCELVEAALRTKREFWLSITARDIARILGLSVDKLAEVLRNENADFEHGTSGAFVDLAECGRQDKQ